MHRWPPGYHHRQYRPPLPRVLAMEAVAHALSRPAGERRSAAWRWAAQNRLRQSRPVAAPAEVAEMTVGERC